MAKRFIDTNIFGDEFFQELSKDAKLYFIYYITNCDHAGILKLNRKLCEFQTGITKLETVSKELGNCIVTVKEGVFFMPKFIKFQYPNFPQSTVQQQKSAVKILKEYNLLDEKDKVILNSMVTVAKELPNSYGNGNGNVIDNGNGSVEGVVGETKDLKKIPPDLSDVIMHFSLTEYPYEAEKFFDYYSANGWMVGKNKMKDWKAATRNWINNCKKYNKNGSNTETPEPKFGRIPISELEAYANNPAPLRFERDNPIE